MVSRARELGWRLPLLGLTIMVVALASFAAGIAVRGALAQPGANTVYACKGDRSGALRVVQAGDTCQRGESFISWNVQGPAGPQGVPGPVGSQGDQGRQGPPGENATPSVSGFVLPDGSIFVGDGFTVERTDVGIYAVTFPPGTWSADFIPTITPMLGPTVSGVGIGLYPDGSGLLEILLTDDASFTFTATQIVE